jgi:hypothetical protein
MQMVPEVFYGSMMDEMVKLSAPDGAMELAKKTPTPVKEKPKRDVTFGGGLGGTGNNPTNDTFPGKK